MYRVKIIVKKEKREIARIEREYDYVYTENAPTLSGDVSFLDKWWLDHVLYIAEWDFEDHVEGMAKKAGLQCEVTTQGEMYFSEKFDGDFIVSPKPKLSQEDYIKLISYGKNNDAE